MWSRSSLVWNVYKSNVCEKAIHSIIFFILFEFSFQGFGQNLSYSFAHWVVKWSSELCLLLKGVWDCLVLRNTNLLFLVCNFHYDIEGISTMFMPCDHCNQELSTTSLCNSGWKCHWETSMYVVVSCVEATFDFL